MTPQSTGISLILPLALAMAVSSVVPAGGQFEPDRHPDPAKFKKAERLEIERFIGQLNALKESQDGVHDRLEKCEERVTELESGFRSHSDRLSRLISISNSLNDLLQQGLKPFSYRSKLIPVADNRDPATKMYPILHFSESQPVLVWVTLFSAWQSGSSVTLRTQSQKTLIFVLRDQGNSQFERLQSSLVCPDSAIGGEWQLGINNNTLFLRTACDYQQGDELFFDVGGLSISPNHVPAPDIPTPGDESN